MAYASAYDAWLDPEAERKNPTPEYAELIRHAVSFENEKLRELVQEAIYARDDADWASIVSTAIALGVELPA